MNGYALIAFIVLLLLVAAQGWEIGRLKSTVASIDKLQDSHQELLMAHQNLIMEMSNLQSAHGKLITALLPK